MAKAFTEYQWIQLRQWCRDHAEFISRHGAEVALKAATRKGADGYVVVVMEKISVDGVAQLAGMVPDLAAMTEAIRLEESRKVMTNH